MIAFLTRASCSPCPKTPEGMILLFPSFYCICGLVGGPGRVAEGEGVPAWLAGVGGGCGGGREARADNV